MYVMAINLRRITVVMEHSSMGYNYENLRMSDCFFESGRRREMILAQMVINLTKSASRKWKPTILSMVRYRLELKA